MNIFKKKNYEQQQSQSDQELNRECLQNVCWHKGYGAGVDDYITLGKAQNWSSSLEDKTAELQEMPSKMEESQHMDAEANWKLSSQDAG